MGDHRWKRRSHLSLAIPTRSSALEVGLLSETDGGLKRDWRHVTGDLTCDKGEVHQGLRKQVIQILQTLGEGSNAWLVSRQGPGDLWDLWARGIDDGQIILLVGSIQRGDLELQPSSSPVRQVPKPIPSTPDN